jgi:diaminopimelate epimerase
MKIPFTKAHGAKNDFLLTWEENAPQDRLVEAAIAICDRHTGIGADGWMTVSREESSEADAAIRLLNSDGSASEISGNGTRCAAALLVRSGLAGDVIRIRTGAGVTHLRLLHRDGDRFEFEMNMGAAAYRSEDVRTRITAAGEEVDVTILNVGNPQCAVFVDSFDLD